MFVAGCTSRGPGPECDVVIAAVANANTPDIQLLDNVPIDNPDRAARVVEYFERAGCPEIIRQTVRSSFNVVCRIAGRMPDTIVIGAHHDKTGGGRGVADNWTGVVILTALVEHYSLKSDSLRSDSLRSDSLRSELEQSTPDGPWHTMEFVGFALEEDEMLGSRKYMAARDASAAPIVQMINLDTIATNRLRMDPRSDETLQCLARSIAFSLGTHIESFGIGRTEGDWAAFRRNRIPFLNLHSLDRRTLESLHSYRDRRSLVDDEMMRSSYTIVLNLIDALDHQVNATL